MIAAMTGPLTIVWAALERAGCDPRGPAHDFYARCPVHNGQGRSLHAFVGADGRAVLWCFAHQCDREPNCAAIGISVAELYPAGHRCARRRSLPHARRSDFRGNARTLANALRAFEVLELSWRAELIVDCPYCGRPNARLVVSPDHQPFVHCEGACSAQMFTEGLAGHLQDRKESS